MSGIRRTEVRGEQWAGVLCEPDDGGGDAGVLVLGGSEGGWHERDAVALAEAGFVALAFGYFGGPGLPPGLVEIPVERFSHGLDLLAETSAGRLGVVGGSRGGEAALLLAVHDPRVAAVVSVVGSGVVTAGIDYTRGGLLDILGAQPTSWTVAGAPVPQLAYVLPDGLRTLVSDGATVPLALAFPDIPASDELERVSIPIERSAAAVLLVSAADDRAWPSTAYSEVAAARLRAHGRAVEHLVVPDAGHLIAGPPGAPITSTVGPGPGITFDFGGTPAGTTAGRMAAWAATLDFLERTLR